jgi:Tfp pilus assembly protein PilZ
MPQQASAAYTAPTAAPRADAAPFKPASARARIDVELGTHSASNFYKGLGGNDVIEAGGIFVATYKPQAIGVSVDLRVLMPGNYEFVATAAVQWIREGDGSTEPGFGARFTQISPEGRQLVYRYTRNREPIFYDDL